MRHRAFEAQNRLARVGLRDVTGYALADEDEWRRQGVALTSVPIWRSEDMVVVLQQGVPFQFVDVRSCAEWLQGHLPGAISVPLLELDPEAAPIDFSRPILVYCQEGYRAMTAASLLLRRKSGDIIVLIAALEGCTPSGPPRNPGASGTTSSVLHRLRGRINRAFSGIDDRYAGVSAHFKVDGRKEIIKLGTVSMEANPRHPGYPGTGPLNQLSMSTPAHSRHRGSKSSDRFA